MVTKKKNEKDLNYYLSLPWSFTVEKDRDDQNRLIYIVRVASWPGVVTDGLTLQEAFDNIQEVLVSIIKDYLEEGYSIPEPPHEKLYKGNIAYRTTPERHYLIAREAHSRNISLSQLIDSTVDSDLRKP